jgi:exonuclease SbcD
VRGRSDLDIARNFLVDVRREPTESEMRWIERALATVDRVSEAEQGARADEVVTASVLGEESA